MAVRRANHHTKQGPKTMELSRQMWSVCCNTIPLFQKKTRNDVLRYCPSSWQCSFSYCSCNKEAPEAFSMGSVWSHRHLPRLGFLWFSSLSLYETVLGGWHFGTMRCRPANRIGWKHRRLASMMRLWKVCTMLRKMSTSGCWLSRELVGRCG